MISRTYDLIDFVEIKLCKGFPNLLKTNRGWPCPMQPPRSPRAIKAKRQLDASSPSDQLTMSGVIDQSVILLKDTTLHNVQFVKYDVTVSFMAQVLDTVTYLVPQVLDTASSSNCLVRLY